MLNFIFFYFTSIFFIFAISTNFSKIYIPEKLKFKRERNFCILNFINLSGKPELDYFSKGLSSVLISHLKFLYYIYEEEPFFEWKQHSFGKNSNHKLKPFSLKEKKTTFTENELKNIQQKKIKNINQDPRFIKLNYKIYEEKISNFVDLYDFSREKNCFYILDGSYKVKDNLNLEVKLKIFSIKNNSIQKFTFKKNQRRFYQEIQPLIQKIRNYLTHEKEWNIEIDSNEENAFIFLNDEFVGKTPSKIQMIGGQYQLKIYKPNFDQIQTKLDIQSNKKFYYRLQKEKKQGLISVNSFPKQAKVYLENEYIGKTPIENKKTKTGWHQIRIEKEGYKTYYKGVKIRKNKAFEVSAELKKENGLEYKKEKYVFLDYTYSDFSLYSLFSVPFFYIPYLYYNTKARQIQDKVYAQSLIYNLNYLDNSFDLNQKETELLYFYEIKERKKKQKKLNRYIQNSGDISTKKAGISIYGMGFMLGLSYWFYQKSISSQFTDFAFYIDEIESFNIHFQVGFRF